MLVFLVTGAFAYLTFSMKSLFYIGRKMMFVSRHMMILLAAFALGL